MKKVYVSGAGMSKFGRRDRTLEEMVREAVENLDGSDASVDALEKTDAVFFGSMSCEKFTGISNLSSRVADQLGMAGKPAVRIETGSSTDQSVVVNVAAGVLLQR